MTDQRNPDTAVETTEERGGINRRRMFLAGAGLAGAAVITKASTASAADGDNVVLGADASDGGVNESSSTTEIVNSGTSSDRSNNAIKGTLSNADNNSHAVLGVTEGEGHAIAGVVNNTTDDAVAATWGRHFGPAAATEGQSLAENQPIAGPANGVKGIVEMPTNGSHAVLGITNGGGHAVAGDTPADAAGADGEGNNTVAATWGRHGGLGAGIGGVNTATDVPLAGPARGVEGIVLDATNGSHAVYGEARGAGHSVAGDTPADAPNTVAATWGRHQGAGAGIGGISVGGYGGEFVGGKASARLIPSDDVAVGAPQDEMHLVGELFVDGAGDLYYNTADGANFTKLNGGGTVMLWDSQRAYDSRAGEAPAGQKGRHAAGEVREIDLTEFTDLPANASGAIINITVADTDALGYALVFNGDTPDSPTPVGSSINWVDAGEFVANGITVALSSTGTVKVYTEKATDVVIDVVAYIS